MVSLAINMEIQMPQELYVYPPRNPHLKGDSTTIVDANTGETYFSCVIMRERKQDWGDPMAVINDERFVFRFCGHTGAINRNLEEEITTARLNPRQIANLQQVYNRMFGKELRVKTRPVAARTSDKSRYPTFT